MVQMIRITTLSIFFACAGMYAMVPQISKPDLGRQLIANIKNGHEDLVASKIANGVDVNAADGDGLTGLMHALNFGREDIANMLIDAKADVNKADADGMIALHIAARRNSLDMCKRLINAGANVNCVSKNRLCSEWGGAPWRGYESSPLAWAVIGGTERIPIGDFLVENMLNVDLAQKQSMLAFMISLRRINAMIPGVYCKDVRQLLFHSLGVAIKEYNFSRTLATIKKLPAFRESQTERINNLFKKYFPHETLFE